MKFQIGQKMYERMQRIAGLPKGPTKKKEIDLLDADMQALGSPLYPSAAAYMNDDSMSQNFKSVLEMLDDPSDPQRKLNGIAALPYVLSQEKAVDAFQKMAQDKAAKERAQISAAGQQGALVQKQTHELNRDSIAAANRKEEKATDLAAQEKQKKEDREFQDKQLKDKQAFDAEQNRLKREADKAADAAKLEADKQKSNEEVARDVKNDGKALATEFSDVYSAINKLKTTAANPKGGIWDTMSMGSADTLRSGKASVLREGDVAQMSNAGGVVDKFQQFFGKLKKGDKFGPEARKQLLDVTKHYEKIYGDAYIDRLSTGVERLKARNLPASQSFDAFQLRLLGSRGVFKDVKPSVGAPSAAEKKKSEVKGAKPKPSPSAAAPTPSASASQGPLEAAKAMSLTPAQVQAGKAAISAVQNNFQEMLKTVESIERRLQRKLTPIEKKLIGIPTVQGGQ